MIVMDPLAKPLSCPCVQGYAQRDYGQLAKQLEQELHRPVRVVYNESLSTALKKETQGQADLVIGKHSVVRFDGERAKLKLSPIARLTDKLGVTTMTGLVVVPADDPAKAVADLAGYRLVFGPPECDEKHAAAIALFQKHGVKLPVKLETSAACSDGACSILENAKTQKGAAVISSYARPLLEGCGTVPKGSLRLVGQTEPVPFIEAFVNEQLPEADRNSLKAALLLVVSDKALLTALETRDGFVPIDEKPTEVAKKK
jgi:ABC-type phosphate/phosphonate transport system substrate-binding protein